MIDVYVVVHLATTCDENGLYVTKDSSEIIEIGWSIIDSSNLKEINRGSILVRPLNTPITPLCTSLTTLTWEMVQNAPTFRDGIIAFDRFLQKSLVSNGKEFAFVTLNGSDLRVQLPREAHDKGVVLPPYLERPRLFDLRAEYTRWQAYHPESAPYTAASLSSICVALDVESRPSFRASEGACLDAEILRALIQKSVPFSQHPDVFTRPFDANADFNAFVNERSKVLHLSNLPHDTTQSELESWFTQYGGRPVTFWTLRSADPNRSLEAGFAVFASHEDAMASLSMNGRALNDRAIEISPSSNRIIERAHEVLCVFPPSKNRPRPGDWTCPSCGFSNFQRRTACFRCSYPSGQQQANTPPNTTHNRTNSQSNYNHNQAATTSEYTSSTTALASQNIYQLQQNQLQQGQLQNQLQQPLQPNPLQQQQQQSHTNIRNYGTLNNNGAAGSGQLQIRSLPSGNSTAGTTVPFRAGDWKCGVNGCNYHNFAKNMYCLRCGGPRSAAATATAPATNGGSIHTRAPSYGGTNYQQKPPQYNYGGLQQAQTQQQTTQTPQSQIPPALYPQQLRQSSGPLPGAQPGW